MMKRVNMSRVILLCLILASGLQAQNEEVIPLNKGWLFLQGDNPEYASPDFDDSSWKPIRVDRIWEEQDYDPYDGFAWYRVKVFIPSRLKKNAFLKEGLKIYLGKINNYDQSYINGQLFGINGENQPEDTPIDTSFIKAPTEMWNHPRRYTLRVDDPRIRWDQENVIAVRVYDEGGQGGLWTGDQTISMVNIRDYVDVDHASQPFVFEDECVKKQIVLANRSDKLTLRGTFSITAQGKLSGKTLFREEETVELSPLQKRAYSVRISSQEQSSSVHYVFSFSDTNEEAEFSEETPYILTPLPPKAPRINGATVYGVRPNRPFHFGIAASGARPMSFEAEDLPKGLKLDAKTGLITGKIFTEGIYPVTLKARNKNGEASRKIDIVVGDQIALTPPMGWNSWNCWGLSVSQEKMLKSARMFVEKGLIHHGWSYVNIDDGWEIKGDSPQPKRSADGTIRVNEKFPDMKALGNEIHALGLKLGIYTSPGPLTCGGYTGSYQHELQDLKTFASWGVDYLKYDWCSYDKIARNHSRSELKKPYILISDMLKKIDRDIVYSICQYGMGLVWEWGEEVGGNLWRATGDITDTWESMSAIGFNQVKNAPYAGPGHWNDPDMLVVGWVGWGPNLHPTKLTPDEQYTHISLWCLLSAPLLLGCDLERLDEFTLNLLTNDEVLAIDQDPRGKQATPLIKEGNVQVWIKELADGNRAVGLFNLGKNTETFRLDITQIIGENELLLRDLWRQKDLGKFEKSFETKIPGHGVVLVKLIAGGD